MTVCGNRLHINRQDTGTKNKKSLCYEVIRPGIASVTARLAEFFFTMDKITRQLKQSRAEAKQAGNHILADTLESVLFIVQGRKATRHITKIQALLRQ